MPTIHLRFYEELNEFIPEEKRKIRFSHTIPFRTSVKDLIESFNIPHTQVNMIIVNDEQRNFSYLVHDNDRISVYPFFHTFNVSSISKIHQKIPNKIRFIADQHLGKLARNLRMCGLDTEFNKHFHEVELVKRANKEERILLTKDHNILKRNDLSFGYFVYASDPEEQLEEVLLQFKLKNEIHFLSRCLECNALLTPIEKSKVENRLPDKVRALHNEFTYCNQCDKIYWQGTHYQKMKQKINTILETTRGKQTTESTEDTEKK